MTKRIWLAGLLGGIGMFLWMSLAHVVLPLGTIGISEIPSEAPLLASMQASMGMTPGLYFFPGIGVPPSASREAQNAAMRNYDQKLAVLPSGLLVYHPPGAKAFTPGQLIIEFLTELLEVLIVVWLLAQTRLGSFARRVGFVTAAGIMASLATNVPYWNWYGFPTNYTVVYMLTEITGYFVAGVIAAFMLRKVFTHS
jgi:hypothetical protein